MLLPDFPQGKGGVGAGGTAQGRSLTRQRMGATPRGFHARCTTQPAPRVAKTPPGDANEPVVEIIARDDLRELSIAASVADGHLEG